MSQKITLQQLESFLWETADITLRVVMYTAMQDEDKLKQMNSHGDSWN